MNPIASLFVSIGADLSGLTNGLNSAVGEAQRGGSAIGNALSGAFKVGLGAAVIGFTALTGGLIASVNAAMEAEEGQAQLAAVLESTGGKAGMTADAVNDLASSLQDVTRFEDDAILGAQNLLLTFTNIGKDVFPQATETVLNMSQALGQDLKSSATQLGKALNDPINGMTALSRVGVAFTEEQKEMIKSLQESGDIMGAQKIILKELEVEFGGAARAAGETFAGKMDILNNKFGDIMETIGGALIPVLTMLADAFIGVVNSPFVQNFASQIANLFDLIASGEDDLNAYWEIFESVFGAQAADLLTEITSTIFQVVESLGFVKDAIVETFKQFSEGDLIGGITMFIGQIGMAFGMAEDSAFEFADSIAAAFESIFSGDGGGASGILATLETLRTSLQGVVTWLVSTFAPAFQQSFNEVFAAALPTLQTFGEWIQGTFLPAMQQLASVVGPILGEAFRILGEFLVTSILPALTALGVWIFQTGLPAFGGFANQVGGALNDAFRIAKQLWEGLVKAFKDSVKFIEDVKAVLEDVSNTIMTTVKAAFDFFVNNIIKPVTEALAALKRYIGEVLTALNNLSTKIGSGIGDFLGDVGGGINDFFGGGGGTQGAFTGDVPSLATGGRGVNVQVVYAPYVSLMDEAEAETKLKPFVREAVMAAMA